MSQPNETWQNSKEHFLCYACFAGVKHHSNKNTSQEQNKNTKSKTKTYVKGITRSFSLRHCKRNHRKKFLALIQFNCHHDKWFKNSIQTRFFFIVKSCIALATYFIILISSSSLYFTDSRDVKAFASSTVANSTNTDPLNARSKSFRMMM